MKLRIMVTAHRSYYKKTQCPRTYLLLHTEDKYKGALGNLLKKIFAKQDEKELETGTFQAIPFEATFDFSNKRTLDQNKLRWSLYTIEANEMNGGQKGSSNLIKPEDLYYQDATDWNPKEVIECHEERIIALEKQYYIIDKKPIANQEGKTIGLRCLCVLRNSQLSIAECAQRIEWQFNRMAENGIPIHDSSQILEYLQQHRQYMNDEKIVLNDQPITNSQYKERNPMCEGCLSEYLGNGSGHLAHINAVGMGRNRDDKELEVNHPSNWLHLCTKCHIEEWHGKGQNYFLKKHPHLRYKVLTALKRNYSPAEGEKPVENLEKPAVSEAQQAIVEQSHHEPEKIDSEALLEHPEVFVHPESSSIFISDKWPKDPEIHSIGRAEQTEELEKLLKEGIENNHFTEHDAALIADQVGFNPEEFDPNWKTIF